MAVKRLNKKGFKSGLYDSVTGIGCKTEKVVDVSDDFPDRDGSDHVLFLYTRDSRRQIVKIIWWSVDEKQELSWRLFHLNTIGNDDATQGLNTEASQLRVSTNDLIRVITANKPAA